MKKSLLTAAALSFCYSAIAHPVNESKPEELVVTAARVEQPIYKTLASTTIITHEEIQRSQATTLPELLSRQPGVNVEHNGGIGSNAAIRMRGTESDQVLVLINGARTSSASNGTTALQHIPIDQIDRIEIVRGPRSSLYGADAMGGIIQIFTKRGEATEQSFSPNTRIEYGSHNTSIVSAGFRGKSNDINYSFQVGHKESDGINRTVNSMGADTDRDGYRETNVSSAFDYKLNNDIALGASYLLSKGTTEFDSGSANDETEFKNESVTTYLNTTITKRLQTRIELGSYKDERKTFGSFPGIFDTKRNSALAQADYSPLEKQTITVGYEYYLDQVSSTTNFTKGERDNSAVFIQYLADLDKTSIQASLREDDNEAFGNTTTGSLAMGFDLSEKTNLSLSYGTAFKAPTFNDLYFPFTDYGFGFTFVGNPELNPEESETIELLLRSAFNETSVSLSIYQTKIDDLIEITGSTLENIEEAKILGAEAILQLTLFNWEADLSLEYIDAVNSETDDRLENRPRGKVTANFSRRFGKWDLTISWLAQTDRITDGNQLGGYNVSDLKASYNFTDEFIVGFNIKNIFNNKYTLIDSFQTYRTEGQTAAIFLSYSH